MKRIVEFATEDGESVFVEVDVTETAPSDDRISLREDVVRQAQQTFEDAMKVVQPMAKAVYARVKSLPQPPAEVEVSFGVKLGVDFGAAIASGNAEANCQIVLRWKQDESHESGT